MISAPSGNSNEPDFIIAINLGIILKLLMNLKDKFKQQKAQQLHEEMTYKIEEEGLTEEEDALAFNTDCVGDHSVCQMAICVKAMPLY
ncbi:MAG: hypothetical protein EZS28_051341 [Streblomastix strix]|uniref:Uncharacterized protein n=1 Tax=Streblomastix strix TaxID=222440 RepID=A0A5J4T563_9EUKA|nr:MAG: hypothetical protein EZS28_051341 [Streblomastix strix]